MTTLHFHRPLTVSASTAWGRLARLDQVHHLISFLSEATVDGDLRVCTLSPDGPLQGELRERILGTDDELRRVSYSIIESPFGFEHHAASMEIREDAQGVSLIWTSDLKPDVVAERMRPMFEAEADHIAAALARTT